MGVDGSVAVYGNTVEEGSLCLQDGRVVEIREDTGQRGNHPTYRQEPLSLRRKSPYLRAGTSLS